MEETGLYAYGVRYYDPVIGRFTGVDPIADQFAFVSGFNYAENSPIANIDLHGLQKWSKIFGPIMRFFGITTGVGPGNNNNPRTAREADQNAGRRAALTKTEEDLDAIVEMQEMAFPLVGTINDAQKGNYGDAAVSTVVDIGATLIPGAKSLKGTKHLDEAAGAIDDIPLDDLAFGLRAGLKEFAKKFNFKTYREFAGPGFQKPKIESAIKSANNNLHVNLDGISGWKFSQFDPTKHVGHGNITNWELHTILATPGALGRTTFYRNGAEASVPYWLK